MVEVRFQSEADSTLWGRPGRARAKVGPDVARVLSLCLQQLSALDSSEDIVRLPFDVKFNDGVVHLDLDGEMTVVARVHRDATEGSEVLVVERIVTA